MSRQKTSKLSSSESKEANKIFGSFHARGFTVKKDEDGFYICTHRCRSKSYKLMRNIPEKVRKWIKSTG
jgi:hypothetical protein